MKCLPVSSSRRLASCVGGASALLRDVWRARDALWRRRRGRLRRVLRQREVRQQVAHGRPQGALRVRLVELVEAETAVLVLLEESTVLFPKSVSSKRLRCMSAFSFDIDSGKANCLMFVTLYFN